MPLAREDFPYCAYYCEENIWQLARDPRLGPGVRHVLLITNPARQTLLFHQRAAPGAFVLWDYHVVLLLEDAGAVSVYDLDTDLPFPCPLRTYLNQTFGDQARVPEQVRPQFRLIPVDVWLSTFSSDRSHMRDEHGGWLQPPPTWPLIGGSEQGGWPLKDAIDLTQQSPGEVLGLNQLIARLG